MADVKISAAADAGTLVATDKVPLARSASTTAYSATMAEIASWTNTNLPVASTSVAGVVKVDGTTITISGGTISGSAAPPASSSLPFMDGTPAPGVATSWSRGDHVHPSDTAKAPLASPTFTGAPAAPTPTTGDNSTKLATTAFVQAQMVASGAGVSTWNTRAGAVVLQQSDITAVGALNDTGRNRLHNVGFGINQRSYVSGTALAAGAYAHDRWKAGGGGCTYTFTQTQPFTTVTITAGSLQQIIEAVNVEGGTYTLSWTGTAQGRVNAGSYAASPVTVSGLSANTAMTIEFNTGTLGRVQLEIGSVATPLAKREYAEEVRLCQRYYQTVNGFQWAAFSNPSTSFATWVFGTQMRAPPSAVVASPAYGTGASNARVGSANMTSVQLAFDSASTNTWCMVSVTASADL